MGRGGLRRGGGEGWSVGRSGELGVMGRGGLGGCREKGENDGKKE